MCRLVSYKVDYAKRIKPTRKQSWKRNIKKVIANRFSTHRTWLNNGGKKSAEEAQNNNKVRINLKKKEKQKVEV